MAWLSLEELKKYDAKKELKKMGQAEKSAASLRSGGQPVEVVRDTGAKDAVKNLLEKHKKSRAIRKEMQSIGQDLRKNKSTDLAAYRRVAQKQVELQKKLPGAAFTAGLLEGMGGNSKDAAVKLIGNDALTKQNEAMQELFKQTQSNHKGMAAAGRLTGEFAKAGAGYMTIGKAAEEATLKGMGALGRRMTASTAPDIAQKAAAKILLNPKNAKAARVAAGLLGQQAADTMVNTPMTIAAGMADGKSRKEIAKDVGKQEAMDAAFNVGLAALGAGAKKAGQVLEPKLAMRREKALQKKGIGKAGEGIKKENVLPGDVTSPSVTPENATAQFSANTVPKTAEGVKNTGLSEKKLLSADEIPEKIRQEYENWNNPDYMGEKLREISEKYSGDSQQFDAEVKKITGRMQELEDMLGIRTQRVKDTEKKIQTGAVREMKKILSLSGKGETEETKKLLQTAVLEGRTGKISEQTRERIFTELFDRGHISNRADIDKDLKNHLKGLTLKISRQDASNIPDFKQWRKGTFGKIRSVGVGEKGNIDSVWMELHEKWPQLFSDEITNPAEQLLKIKEVADEMTYREIPLAETIDSGARDGLKAEFDSAMDRLQTELQKLTAYTNDRAVVQKRKLMQEGIPLQVDYNKMSTKEMKELYNQRYQYKKAADKVRSRKNLTEGDKALLDKLHRGELDAETAKKYAGLNGDDLIEVYNAEKPLYATNQMIREYKKQANSRFDGDFSDIMGDIPIQSEGKKGWRDLSPLRLMRETQERILDMIAPTKEQAGRLKQTLFDPIHANERDRTLFKNAFIDRLKQTDINTKNNIPIKLPNGENVKTSESALVQWLGENRYQLRQMERKKGRATVEEIANEQELRRQIEHIERSLSREQLQRIDNGIAEFTEIYKEIHPKINEALIRNGYEPVGYIEGYFPHMNFDDPNNVVEAMAKKLGFADGHCRKNGNLPSGEEMGRKSADENRNRNGLRCAACLRPIH